MVVEVEASTLLTCREACGGDRATLPRAEWVGEGGAAEKPAPAAAAAVPFPREGGWADDLRDAVEAALRRERALFKLLPPLLALA